MDVVNISQSSQSLSTACQSLVLPPTRDSILQNEHSSDCDQPLDISQSQTGKRCRKSNKYSTKKDRCPYKLSATLLPGNRSAVSVIKLCTHRTL